MATPGNRIRVVIADDNPVNQALCEAWVRKVGNCDLVGTAADGIEAVELVLRTQPDLLLLDYLMPGLDGVEAARILRKLQSRVKIIMISASTSPIPWMEAGVDIFLGKNGNFKDLTRSIETLFPATSA